MVCSNEVDTGLWQIARRHPPETFPEADIALVMCSRVPDGLTIPWVHLPFPDSTDGVPETLFAALQAVCASVADRRVLTICDEGKNRSGLASALILKARGLEPGAAVARVRDRASAPGTVGALSNPAFVQQFMETP